MESNHAGQSGFYQTVCMQRQENRPVMTIETIPWPYSLSLENLYENYYIAGFMSSKVHFDSMC